MTANRIKHISQNNKSTSNKHKQIEQPSIQTNRTNIKQTTQQKPNQQTLNKLSQKQFNNK